MQSLDKVLQPQDLLHAHQQQHVRAESTERLESIGEGAQGEGAARESVQASPLPPTTSTSPQAVHVQQPFSYHPLDGYDVGGGVRAAGSARPAPLVFSRTTVLHSETVNTRDDLVKLERQTLAQDAEALSASLLEFEKAVQIHVSQFTAAEAQIRSLTSAL